MKLYFEAGKEKRLAIDTELKTCNTNYYYLGPHRHYIKISVGDYYDMVYDLANEGWKYDDDFGRPKA